MTRRAVAFGSVPQWRAVAAMLIPLVTARCTSWHAAGVEPRTMDESRHTEVRVTTQDSARYLMRGLQVVGDTLVGLGGPGQTFAIGVRDIATVEVRRASPIKTVALVLGLFAIVGLAGAVAVAHGWSTGASR